jgi:hypothetical protein
MLHKYIYCCCYSSIRCIKRVTLIIIHPIKYKYNYLNTFFKLSYCYSLTYIFHHKYARENNLYYRVGCAYAYYYTVLFLIATHYTLCLSVRKYNYYYIKKVLYLFTLNKLTLLIITIY